MYPGADSTENLLQLNEGMAEHTGLVVSKRSIEQILAPFTKSIDQFFAKPTFVRAFAYFTIPIYSYLLRSKDKYWNRHITVITNLTDYFETAFGLYPDDVMNYNFGDAKYQYNGSTIIREVIKRVKYRKITIAQ